jgi:hypothetical protein
MARPVSNPVQSLAPPSPISQPSSRKRHRPRSRSKGTKTIPFLDEYLEKVLRPKIQIVYLETQPPSQSAFRKSFCDKFGVMISTSRWNQWMAAMNLKFVRTAVLTLDGPVAPRPRQQPSPVFTEEVFDGAVEESDVEFVRPEPVRRTPAFNPPVQGLPPDMFGELDNPLPGVG